MSSIKPPVNRQYKDRLFRKLFGDASNKENTLSLYNALNHSHYTNPDDIEITTIEDAIYLGVKNDVSFIIDDYMNLYEQQSTINLNMPLRGLLYSASVYEAYLVTNDIDIYTSRRVKIPTPRYVVLYNGQRLVEPVQKLRLSDSYIHASKETSQDFEWTATVYDLNQNEELLSLCKPLSDYMTLVRKVNDNLKQNSTRREAVDQAIKWCIQQGIMVKYLSKNIAEVTEMILTEYDAEKHERNIRNEAREEGIEIGREQGEKQGLEKGREQGEKRGLEKGKERMNICMLRLLAGESPQKLLQDGFDQDWIATAENLINQARGNG